MCLLTIAAVITSKPILTSDGFNTMYQVNHLSHVLLTHLLLPNLTTSDSSRIVVVGSQLYRKVPEDLADPMLFHRLRDPDHDLDPQQQQQQQQQSRSAAAAAPPTPMQLYSITKLYNLWFVKHFAAAVLPQLTGGGGSGKPVINAVSPGFVPTSGELLRGRLYTFFVNYWGKVSSADYSVSRETTTITPRCSSSTALAA